MRSTTSLGQLEVLDVHGGDDVDAGVEQLVDVLPALRVAAAGTLVWASSSTSATAGRRARGRRRHPSPAAHVPVSQPPARHDLQVTDLSRRPRSAVGLDKSDHDVGAAVGGRAALVQHGVGLAHARCGAEVQAQRPPAGPGGAVGGRGGTWVAATRRAGGPLRAPAPGRGVEHDHRGHGAVRTVRALSSPPRSPPWRPGPARG